MDSKLIIKQSLKLMSQKQYSQAERMLSDALVKNPSNAELYFVLGNLFHEQGLIGKAIKAFTKALELEPEHTEASISLSILFNDIGKYDDAKKLFESTTERVKGPSSEQAIQKDTKVNSKFAEKHYELAELYMSYDRLDEALFEYQKAINLNHTLTEVKVKMAKAYSRKGFQAKAIDVLNQAKKEHPNDAAIRLALGLVYFGQGDIIRAQSEWQKAISVEPNNHDAKMYLELSQNANETSL
jgi:tetratricopeptide (TPR) repeat protein